METRSSHNSPYTHPGTRRTRDRLRNRPVAVSVHAFGRTMQRTSFDHELVRAMVEHGKAIVLPWTMPAEVGERTYHLIYDRTRADFVVAVVARDVRDRSSLCIVTILTREQVERDIGALPVRHLRMAASRALGPDEFRRWEDSNADARTRQPHYIVQSFYRRDDGAAPSRARPPHMSFHGAPVCREFVNEHGLSQVAGHPGFWEWYAGKAAAAGLPVDRVVALRIDDTQKVEIDINAPARACPCCEARKPLFAFAH